MLLLAFRSFFFIAVILGYSTGIWRLINDYFRREFQSYLEVEAQTNQYLLRDPPKAVLAPDAPDKQLPVGGRQLVPSPPPTPPPLDGNHQQVTDSIMALFEPITLDADANVDRKVSSNRQEGTVGGDKGPPEAATQRVGQDGTLPVTTAVVAAAEATDIRSRNGKQPLAEEDDDRTGRKGTMEQEKQEQEKEEAEEQDKWISYWSERGRRAGVPVDDNANAYCTVPSRPDSYAETLAGAVTRMRERTVGGDALGCD
ncbi:histone-lysine N-methyltransferase EHMT2-like [Anopheles arabiensis]|uniref:Uncharacterized protein n=1 Tax=Anopheles arabiensis TaxID=7173 RepID=A0A182I9H2_ANOAR|nr:histone-lysine N-methyltransferase EHMT2-like [Anopheles arabiensis]